MPRLALTVLALMAGIFGASGPASAASITLEPPIAAPLFSPYPAQTFEGMNLQGFDVDLSVHQHIRLEGEILEGDSERLRALIESMDIDLFGNTILSLASPGGNFAEALAIGDILSSYSIATYVDDGDVCLSACAFAYLGGRRMLLRNTYWEPWRFLHEGAVLGFHSPSLPGGVPREVLDAVGADVLFAEIATPTLDNIRELQARADRWSLTNTLLFEILGRVGADQFFFVERLEEAVENYVTVVSAPRSTMPALGMMEASVACRMVLRERSRATGLAVAIAEPETPGLMHELTYRQVIDNVAATPEDLGQEAFQIEEFLPSQGSPICTVWIQDGAFRVAYDQSFVGSSLAPGAEALPDGRIVFNVHPRAVIGYGLPWSAVSGTDLPVGDREAIYADWPAPYLDLAATFDFCAPRDPATWELICRFDTLHEAVRMLTAVVETHRADRPDAPQVYADWQRDVRRYCRPGVGAGDLREMMLGYCGFAVTQTHLFRAKWYWLDGRVEESPL